MVGQAQGKHKCTSNEERKSARQLPGTDWPGPRAMNSDLSSALSLD